MKKHLLKFKSWLLLLCMIVVGNYAAWAQSDKSTDYTGNITLSTTGGTSASACKVVINQTQYDGIKAGTGKAAGAVKVTVPSGAKYLHIHVAGWNGESVTLSVSPSSNVSSSSIGLTADSGVSNNSPFTLAGTLSNYYKVITFTNALTANTDFTFTATGGKRFVIWGVTSEETVAAKEDPEITFNNGSVRVGQNLDLSTLFESNSDGAVTYSITEGSSYASIDGSTLTGVAEGEVTVKAEQAAAGNYNAGEASATITVNAALALSSITITTPPTKIIYTEGETFDPTGMVVTATYSDSSTGNVTTSCTFSPSTALTTSDTEITVSYTENAVEKTTTQAITVNPLPIYTVTFSDGGSETQASYGASVTLPSRSAISAYTFAGWSATNVPTETTMAPTIIPAGSYTPTGNIILYPVYTKTESGVAPSAFSVGDTGDFAIVAELSAENYYALPTSPTVSSGKITAQKITVSEIDDVKFVTPANASGFTWTIAAATNGYTLSDGSHYIYHSNGGSSGTNLTYGDATTYTWAFTADGNYIKMAGMSGSTTNNRGLLFNGTTIGGYALSNWESYDKTMILPIANAGTTYYWSAPVAAAVEKPTITVAENPFLFSTTATITCETVGAAIKYSYNGETWNDYSEALTITATTTIYAKAVKDANESTVASVTATKNLATPTVTISGDLTVDLNGETDVEAGTLTAAVTYNEAPVEGAAVTWSSSNVDVATIGENTGVVTIKTRGTVTFTATYAGNGDYAEATDTKQITVTDSKAPGSAGNPYTVEQAKAAIDAGVGITGVYVAGIVSQVDSYNSTYKSITYWISDDGTTTNQFEVYSGKGIGGADFSRVEDIQVGDVVVVNGDIKLYHTTYEFDKNNQLVSLVRKVATPTFDPAAGEVIAGSTVTISTTTEDATIYYTTNGDEPTTESTLYTGPITIDADQTIKAIAVKDGMTNSDVASASYTIIVTPTIAISTNSIEATAAGADDIVALAYSNLTIGDESDFAVQYYDNLGEETDAPNWMEAEVLTEDGENYSVSYTIGENTSTEPRTAYFKVYAMDDETNLVYSDLVTVTQAGMVIDYVTLPFEYNGGRDDIPTGLTQSGLGTDYNSSTAPNTQLKFDGSSDELTLKINEAATILSFNIKGNSFSGGTFKVQTSVDGEDYNDLETYKELSESQETFVLGANIRYIKWIYTKKQSGNVGLGNIKVEKRMGDATVTLASACNDGEGNYYGTYSNTTGFVVPEGLTVAEVGINAENKLIVEEYATGAIVPANTGVMVSSTTDGAHDIVLSTGGTSVLGEDNRLRASGAGITAEAMAAADSECLFYRLTMHNGTDIGFWWGAAEGAAFNLAANKAYLAVSNAVSVKGFSLFSDDETGITEVAEKTEGTEKVFDLSGRRVVKPTKGLYIVNGKKYIKK